MNPEQIQDTHGELSTDQAAASLALATNLQDQLIPRVPQEEKVVEEVAQPVIDQEALKKDILKDVKSIVKEEMASLREEIKSALSDDDESEEE